MMEGHCVVETNTISAPHLPCPLKPIGEYNGWAYCAAHEKFVRHQYDWWAQRQGDITGVPYNQFPP